jgi:hypothetical protein
MMASFPHVPQLNIDRLTYAELTSGGAYGSVRLKHLAAKETEEQAVPTYLEPVQIAVTVHAPHGLATHGSHVTSRCSDGYLHEAAGAAG